MGVPATFRIRAIEMAKRGVRPALIAEIIEVEPVVIHQLLKDARRAGEDIPRFAGGPVPGRGVPHQMRLRVDPACFDRLDRAAEARGITRPVLCARLIEVITAEDLIDSVLDDEGQDD